MLSILTSALYKTIVGKVLPTAVYSKTAVTNIWSMDHLRAAYFRVLSVEGSIKYSF
jgi:hypothetical protein